MWPVAVALCAYLFGIFYRPLLWLGFAVQSGYLAWRGISQGRLPLVGVHDTLNFLGASTMGFALAMGLLKQFDKKSPFMRLIAGLAAFFSAAALFQRPHFMPLPPVLKTYWFELHVALSFMSYALFAIAAAMAVLYIKSPDPAHERVAYRAGLIGYCLFSLSMIFGAVWAYYAWATYWLWTPKELWTVMLWLYYSLYLHVRSMGPSMRGKASAIMLIAGFAIVMFTYLGVGLLMKSSHAF